MKASEQAVIQNLKDAGCCRETVERFFREERRIQCLDYLVYQMEKESPKE